MKRKYTLLILLSILIIFCCLIYSIQSIPKREGFQANGLYTLSPTIEPTASVGPSIVPRTVYQSWNTYTVPISMYNAVKENAKRNPAFRFELYDDERSVQYLREHFNAEVAEAFLTLKPGAYKSDLWRLCILYKEGGIYMDMKFSNVIPLEELVHDEQPKFVQDLTPTHVYQGFFVSKPGEPILKEGIDKIVENVRNRFYGSNFLEVTGPAMIGPIIHRVNPNLIVYKLVVDTGDIHTIRTMDGKEVLRQYSEYRQDQKKNGAKHYKQMWDERDIFM